MNKLTYSQAAAISGENMGQQVAKAAQESFHQRQEEEAQKWIAAGYKPQDLVLELYPCTTEATREGIIVRQNFKIRPKTDTEVDEEARQVAIQDKWQREQARAFLCRLLNPIDRFNYFLEGVAGYYYKDSIQISS